MFCKADLCLKTHKRQWKWGDRDICSSRIKLKDLNHIKTVGNVGNFNFEWLCYFGNCGLYKLAQDVLSGEYEIGLPCPPNVSKSQV